MKIRRPRECFAYVGVHVTAFFACGLDVRRPVSDLHANWLLQYPYQERRVQLEKVQEVVVLHIERLPVEPSDFVNSLSAP